MYFTNFAALMNVRRYYSRKIAEFSENNPLMCSDILQYNVRRISKSPVCIHHSLEFLDFKTTAKRNHVSS